MKYTIFYSWQSDLPSSTNRTFIENCIKKSIKELKNNINLTYYLSLERDTKNDLGSPDITQAIFKKINKSKLFIADISFINKNSKFKKTPNPNVLLELGYAARAIGWEKIICIFNTDFGKLEDLPFNLRQHRPLTYSTKDKKLNQDKIIQTITGTFITLKKKGMIDDIIDDYLKLQVDTEILTCINYLMKIVYGYDHKQTLTEFKKFIKIPFQELKEQLANREFLGFQLFKVWDINELKLKEIAEKSMFSSHFDSEFGRVILEIMKWVSIFNNRISEGYQNKIFKLLESNQKDYKIIKGSDLNPSNKEFPNRFLLLKKLKDDQVIVLDFGDFLTQESILLNNYIIGENHVEYFAYQIAQFNELANKWLSLTNEVFLVDNVKNFKIYSQTK